MTNIYTMGPLESRLSLEESPNGDGMAEAVKAADALATALHACNSAGKPLDDGISPDGAFTQVARALRTVLTSITGNEHMAEALYQGVMDGDRPSEILSDTQRIGTMLYEAVQGSGELHDDILRSLLLSYSNAEVRVVADGMSYEDHVGFKRRMIDGIISERYSY